MRQIIPRGEDKWFLALGVILAIAVLGVLILRGESTREIASRTERVVACPDLRAPECRTLSVRVMRACVEFAPCRKALLARNEAELREQIKRAVERLEGGDAIGPSGPPGNSPPPSGLPGELRLPLPNITKTVRLIPDPPEPVPEPPPPPDTPEEVVVPVPETPPPTLP